MMLTILAFVNHYQYIELISFLLTILLKSNSFPFFFQRFIQTMRAIQGALIVSSSIQIILGYSQLWGLFSRYVSDLVASLVFGGSYSLVAWCFYADYVHLHVLTDSLVLLGWHQLLDWSA